MLQHLIPLIGSFLSNELRDMLLYPLFCVYFVAAVPSLFKSLSSWR